MNTDDEHLLSAFLMDFLTLNIITIAFVPIISCLFSCIIHLTEIKPNQMKKRVVRYLKHVLVTLLVLLVTGASTLYYLNGSLNYGQNPIAYKLDNEGPYVFYENDSIVSINYLKGTRTNGFFVKSDSCNIKKKTSLSCYFPLDSSSFKFELNYTIKPPKSTYSTGKKVLAISDIESGFKTFRDFLIRNNVINEKLEWIFNDNHLVLVGDFVDRGNSTTQVLWFIYMLEQKAKQHGGNVHFIIGNHELYNLQGQYKSSEKKYYAIASILGKLPYQLYNNNSFLGRWLASKNSIELINGTLFTHGGIHPEIAKTSISIDEINAINRKHYFKPYFPKPKKTVEQLITSNKKGVCWYRGYFKNELTQDEVEKGLNNFNAKSIVVGHTLQSKVKKLYKGKVYAIDVVHPKDYINSWPNRKSEGLLIEGEKYYRVFHNGKVEQL